MPRRVPVAFLIPAVALFAACGAGEAGPPELDTGLDAPDRIVDLSPQPVFAVGGFDGPDWAAFGDIRQVALNDDGHLFILDSQANTVTEVDGQGRFVRTIGRPGEGPGELSTPFSFTFTADGGVAVFDFGHQAWVVYGPDGEYLRNVRIEMGEVGFPGNRLAPHPRGGVVASIGGRIRMGGPGAAADEPEEPSRPVAYFALSEDDSSRVVYDAWAMPDPPEGEEQTLSTSGGGTLQLRMPILRAFEPVLRSAVLPDGRIAVVDSVGYRIKLVDLSGSVTGTLERPLEPTSVTGGIEEEERQRRLDELEDEEGGAMMITVRGGSGGGTVTNSGPGGMSDMMRNRIETMIFADEIPVIEDMAVDGQGRIWVQRSSGEPGVDGPTDLLTADGRYLGTLAPGGARIPMAFGPDGLLVRQELDEFDVPTLIVERLPAEIR